MKKLSDHLKKIFPFVKNRTRVIMIISILIVLGLVYSIYAWQLLFLVFFVIVGGISKIYHRFFRSSIGIDLVFFTTVILSLVYKNLFFSLTNAWLGLIIADTLGQKFSHTSLISLIGLTAIAIIARFLPFTLIISAILLTIIFEIYSIAAYGFLGSSPDKIILYLVSHLAFNLFLILTFAESLAGLMV